MRGKVFVVVAGGDYKEGRLYPGTVQRGQTSGVVLLGPSSKVRQTHFSGIGSGSGDVSTEDAEAGETSFRPAPGSGRSPGSYGRLCTAEYPHVRTPPPPRQKAAKGSTTIFDVAGSERVISKTSFLSHFCTELHLQDMNGKKIYEKTLDIAGGVWYYT